MYGGHKCHGKRKKLPTKGTFPRQKKNADGRKEIGQGKRTKLAVNKNARGKK